MGCTCSKFFIRFIYSWVFSTPDGYRSVLIKHVAVLASSAEKLKAALQKKKKTLTKSEDPVVAH